MELSYHLLKLMYTLEQEIVTLRSRTVNNFVLPYRSCQGSRPASASVSGPGYVPGSGRRLEEYRLAGYEHWPDPCFLQLGANC